MNHILSKIFYGPIFFKGNKKITSEIFASFPKCGATVLDFHQQSIGIPVNYNLASIWSLKILNFSHTEVSGMVSCGDFNWYFSDDEQCCTPFQGFIGKFYSFLWEVSKSFAHFIRVLFIICLWKLLHVLNMRPCQIHALQTFSPSLRLAFPFLDHAVQVRSLLFGWSPIC